MRPVVELAPAKINLALAVTGRRDDGYHLLDSLVTFADLGDLLTVEPADGLVLRLAGPFGADLPGDGDNLVVRAAEALRTVAAREGRSVPGVRIVLEKRLPVASGIGGGSADAAAVLRALDRVWRLGLGPVRLAEIGIDLGADLPMCLAARPLRASGIGDVLQPVPGFPTLDLVLANPRAAVPTGEVFRRLAGGGSAPLPDPAGLCDAADVAAYVKATGNDLRAPASELVPAIDEVLGALEGSDGCLGAGMSGSGATCFAIFADVAAAAAAAGALRRSRPGWWIAACRTGASPDAPG